MSGIKFDIFGIPDKEDYVIVQNVVMRNLIDTLGEALQFVRRGSDKFDAVPATDESVARWWTCFHEAKTAFYDLQVPTPDLVSHAIDDLKAVSNETAKGKTQEEET